MLSDVQKFQADFNLQMVPAPLGLAVPPEAEALMFGAPPDDLCAYLQESEVAVRLTARRLLGHPELAAALDRWPPPGVSKVMFVGDSITTYLYSYARLLPAMLDLRQPGHGVQFRNVAQSGYTTTHALECTHTQYMLEQPDWVFIKLGVNDTKQFGNPQGRTLVPLDTYRANIDAMVAAFRQYTRAHVVLLSPTPVVEPVTNALPDFVTVRLTWDNHTIRRFGSAVAEIATQHAVDFIDLFEISGFSPQPEDYVADGVHPGPLGHERIVTAILRSLEKS